MSSASCGRAVFDNAVRPDTRVGEGPFVMVHAPTEHFLRIFEHQSVTGGVSGEIAKFVRVILEIKK